MFDSALRSASSIAFLAAPLLAAQAQKPIEELTAHYDLRYEGSPDEAKELGVVLEQAWNGFAKFFGVNSEPKELYKVRVVATQTSLRIWSGNENAELVSSGDPIHLSRKNGAVYALKQKEPYSTRFYVLYGACLQFHVLAKAKNADIADAWYAAGIANVLARHTWDGKTLVLDGTPLVGPFDLAARALAHLEADPGWIPDVAGTSFGKPELGWSAVGLCIGSGRERYRAAFDKYALGGTGTKMSGEDFLRTLGPRVELARNLRAWVVDRVQPFEGIAGAWEDLGVRRIKGMSPRNDAALCALREPCEELAATLAALPRTGVRAGFITSLSPADQTFVAILIEAPKFRWERWRGKRLLAYDEIELRGDCCQDRRVRFVRRRSETTIHVDEHEFGPFDFPNGRTGFYVVGGAATFRDVSWR